MIQNQTDRWEYDGDGVSTVFGYDNVIFAAENIAIYVGGVLLTLNVDYTVSGTPAFLAGNVTFAVAPAIGDKNVIIQRSVPALQKTQFPPGNAFPSAAVEVAFDRLTVLVQQIRTYVGRFLQFNVATPSDVSSVLPLPVNNGYLGWTGDGKALENKVAPGGAVVYSSIANTRIGTATAEAVTPRDLASLHRKGADIASAATLVKPIDNNLGGYHRITGAVPLQHLWAGDYDGAEYELEAVGALPVVDGADFQTYTRTSFTMKPGDRFRVRQLGGDIWAMTAFTAIDGRDILAATPGNLVINGDFRVFQRENITTLAPITCADGAYAVDMFYVLTQTGTIEVDRTYDPETGRPFALRLKQTQALAQRMGAATAILGSNCKQLRSAQAIAGVRIRCSVSQQINYAMVELTTTEDQITRDIVNNWLSGVLTPGNFFKAANLNVIAIGSVTPAANTFTDLATPAAAFGAGLNNAVLFCWTDAVAAQNVTLELEDVQLVPGKLLPAFRPRPFELERALCGNYLRAARSAVVIGMGPCVSTTAMRAWILFDPPMRTLPSLALLNAVAANFQVSNAADTGVAVTALTMTSASRAGAWLSATVAAGLVAGNTSRLWCNSEAVTGLVFSAEL